VSTLPEKDEAGDGAIRPSHGADHLHPVPLIECTRRLVLLPDSEVKASAERGNYLSAKPLEYPTTRPAVLDSVDDLVQHDRTSGDIDSSNPRSFQVSLVRDHHPVLVYALPSKDSPFQRILPDVGEDIPVNLEMSENLLQLVGGGVVHAPFLNLGATTGGLQVRRLRAVLFSHSRFPLNCLTSIMGVTFRDFNWNTAGQIMAANGY
jgi:hypothetical protein